MTASRRCAALLFGTACAVWVLDRVTKLWVEDSLAGRPPITVIPPVLDLRYTVNSGGAFSLGQSAPWLFAAATIVISGLIVATAFRHTKVSTAVALGLVLGGALGNLTDRIARGPRLTGRVVDFIDFHVWPVFNLADSAIVVGAIVLVWSTMDPRRRGEVARGDAA